MMIVDFVVNCDEGSGVVVFTGWGNGGDGSGNSGGGPNGNGGYWDCPEPQIPTGPLEPIDDTGTGDCVFIPTNPNTGTPPTPCERIQPSTNNEKYIENITSLEGKTGQSYESGYRLGSPLPGQNGTQNQLLQNRPGSKEVDMKIFNNTYALMHSHYDGLIPIFSPGDLLFFNQWIVWANQYNAVATNTPKIPINNLTFTVVTSNGNYLLSFDGITANAFPNYSQQHLNDINDDYRNDYLRNAATVGNVSGEITYDMDKVEKEFLSFAKDKMNMPGLKLFKVGSNGTNTEIYLENGNRRTRQCP